MTQFSIIKPDDMHVHLRDGDVLKAVAPYTARQFARAVVMPNLVPPVTTVFLADGYRQSLVAAANFTPLMTLYLTDNTTPAEIGKVANCDFVKAIKYYPAGATTNSDSGVTDITKTYKVLEAMEKAGLPLLLHGEVTEKEVDIFDREAVFIDKILQPLSQKFPALKIVFEHITTRQAAQFVADAPTNIAATITPHHLLYNRNHMLVGGVRPHYYCLPILKREEHRKALLAAALSGSKKFFAGTDSAPHLQDKKESACGCAGCFNAPYAVEFYAMAFDAEDLSKPQTQTKFENFMSKSGADFYGLAYNQEKITITKTNQKIADSIAGIIPLNAGTEISWQVTYA